MNKKYYTVFFASERDNYSRSFQISKKGLIVLVLFGILLLGLAFIGGIRLLNREPLTRELNNLKDDSILLEKIIYDLNYSHLLDSSNVYEKFVAEFYTKHKLGFPEIAPVEGYVTRGIQFDNNHLGIDIAAKHRDKIYVPFEGRVIFSGTGEDMGNTLVVSHAAGFITVYGHNDTNLVKTGEELKRGQIISLVGDTGMSQGPHLHFEIWKNNHVLDPREIIKIYKKRDVSIR